MPIHSRRNLYRGVNAHLQSLLQAERGRWTSFHASHIEDLRDWIESHLPANYIADNEEPLQISELDADFFDEQRRSLSRSDILISMTSASSSAASVASDSLTTSPTLTLAAEDTLTQQEETARAVVIYRIEEDSASKPCTRIELLSPANKPPGIGYIHYLRKRDEAIRSGLRLVEIDFLHQSRPSIARLPSYPDRDPGATPYMIIVTDPRPMLEVGRTNVYGFHVDDLIPAIPTPLAGQDVLIVDFGEAYRRTFEKRRRFQQMVDYGILPERFEAYSALDQGRIQARMSMIREEHAPS